MGWWSPPKDPSIRIGDEVMDRTYDYLERLAALYREGLKRPMTVEELQAVLSLALRVIGDERIFHQFGEKKVESVVIKAVKRPKRQEYAVGDIFALPLGKGKYAFGRIMNLADGWDLVEIFAYTARTPQYTPAIAGSGRLMLLLLGSPREYFDDWAWKVIQSDPDYTPSELAKLRFVMGTPGHYRVVRVNGFRPEGSIPDAEAEELPKWESGTLEGAVKAIKKALAERRPT